jgi:hypothetical protein
MKCSTDCFVKINKGYRKFRRVFMSDVYVYVLSE